MNSRLTLVPIPDELADVWERVQWVVDDQGRLRLAELRNAKYGTLYFGKFSDGHLGWRWAENGGGGSVTIVFAREPGKDLFAGLWMGLVLEDRLNMAERAVPCITGGFVKDPSVDSHHATHRREFADETGGDAEGDEQLPGAPFNSDRNYFIADPDKGEGCCAFAVEVPWVKLVPTAVEGTLEHASWMPKNRKLVFMHWTMMAVATPDALAGLPMIRLLADLYEAEFTLKRAA